jgi:hypothetical protein
VVPAAAAESKRQTPKKDISEAAIQKELDTLEILLSAKINRSSVSIEEYIQMRQIQGASLEAIRSDLLTDLKDGGRIFGEFTNALKPTFAGSTNRFRDAGALAEMGISNKYLWVAVLVNTCPDCLERHNQKKDWAEWEAEGLPRTGATVCKEHCKCVLVPAEITKLEPIYRSR